MATITAPTRPHIADESIILSKNQMRYRLRKHGVSRRQWGRGTNRSFADLMSYHETDKLYPRNGSSDRFILDVQVAVVIVIHKYQGQWLELYEDRQEFAVGNGHVHVLRREGFNGIAETSRREEKDSPTNIHCTTNMEKTAVRCIEEELHLYDPSRYSMSKCLHVEHCEPRLSEKWPGGVWAAYHRHIFECEIDRSIFRKDGYFETEVNRRIYFKWRPRRQLQFTL